MARLSNEVMRSPAYVDRLLTEADEALTKAQNTVFEILADAKSDTSPADLEALVNKASTLGTTAGMLARVISAMKNQLAKVEELKAQLASKGDAKPAGKTAKVAAAAE